MLFAPASAKAAIWCSGRSIMRCTSSTTSNSRSACTAIGPIVIGGTKGAAMTSTWMTSAPASTTSRTCSRSRPKSADRIEGATRRVTPCLHPVGAGGNERRASRPARPEGLRPSYCLEHAGAAGVALHARRRSHSHDRRVFTALRTHRLQLEAVEAVDAAVAAREVCGTQPGLRTVGAGEPEVDRLSHRWQYRTRR